MSPEQLRGLVIDTRSDIWALGAVLYESLTTRSPFRRSTKETTIAAILGDEPDSLGPDLPGQPLIQAVVDRALAKEPEQRYSDAETMVEDLRAVLASLTESSINSTARLGLRAIVRKRWTRREILDDLCFRPYRNDAAFLARLDPDFEADTPESPALAAPPSREPAGETGS